MHGLERDVGNPRMRCLPAPAVRQPEPPANSPSQVFWLGLSPPPYTQVVSYIILASSLALAASNIDSAHLKLLPALLHSTFSWSVSR